MNLKETIKNLSELASDSIKEGYRGDATEYQFRRHVLILLEEILKTLSKKRKISKWNLFVDEYFKKGKSIKEASKDWRKK